jgi:hypothetical protein
MPKRMGYPCFQAPSILQEHGDEKNLKDKLLLANPKNSSNLEFVNNWRSDYNKRTNVPFVY